MRVAEIAIVARDLQTKKAFIEIICDEIETFAEDLIFGRLKINNQLAVHLYGLAFTDKATRPSWDLVSQKLLGYIVLFNWDKPESYSTVRSTIDNLSTRYNLPMVVAANLQNGSTRVPKQLVNVEFNLSDASEFTFFNLSEPKSVKEVLVNLIDSVLERIY